MSTETPIGVSCPGRRNRRGDGSDAEAGGDHVNRNAGQQESRGMDVPQVVQPRVRQWFGRSLPVLLTTPGITGSEFVG